MTIKIEFKKFAHYPRMSEETLAWVAEDVIINGKSYGYGKNDGQGGCDCIHHLAQEVLEDYAKTLPERSEELGNGETFTYKPSWETVLSDAVYAKVNEKQRAKPWVKITCKNGEEPIYWALSKWGSLSKQLWIKPKPEFVQKKKSELLLGTLTHSLYEFSVVHGSEVPDEYLGA